MPKITLDADEGVMEFILPDEFVISIPESKLWTTPSDGRFYYYRRLIAVDMLLHEDGTPFPVRICVPTADEKLGPLFRDALEELVGGQIMTVMMAMARGLSGEPFEVGDDELEHIRHELEADASR